MATYNNSTYETGLSNLSYINKDFQTIYPEFLDLAKSLSQKWDPTISNESDPGVLLLKLCAIMADKNNYNIDQNILECFPETVSQIYNARPLFQQLGYNMSWYRGAEAQVSFQWISRDEDEEIIRGEYVKIPKFTMVSDEDQSIVYTTTEETVLQIRGSTVTVPAIQGIATKLTINGNSLITSRDLDSNNRIYFPDYYVAENGIFITNKGQNNYDSWSQVDNLSVEQLGSRIYKFGVNKKATNCYLEFPDDIEDLLGEGIEITYLVTVGEEGKIKREFISQLYSEITTTIQEVEVKLSTDNVTITNFNASSSGYAPETIDQAYKNYQKTIGTFTTLVSLKDYQNYINSIDKVSNCVVSDRTNDIQSSYHIVTTNGQLIRKILHVDTQLVTLKSIQQTVQNTNTATINVSENTSAYGVIDTAEVTNLISNQPVMGPFDLKLYALQYVDSPTTAAEYNNSFNILPYTENSQSSTIYSIITSELDDVKCIQHDFVYHSDGKMCLLKNKFPIKLRVVPKYKLTTLQYQQVSENIRVALYENLKSKSCEFGKLISYSDVYDIVQNADDRIKSVVMDDISFTTYAVYPEITSVDGKSVTTYKEVIISDNYKEQYICGHFYRKNLDENVRVSKFIDSNTNITDWRESATFVLSLDGKYVVTSSDTVLDSSIVDTVIDFNTFSEAITNPIGKFNEKCKGSYYLIQSGASGVVNKITKAINGAQTPITLWSGQAVQIQESKNYYDVDGVYWLCCSFTIDPKTQYFEYSITQLYNVGDKVKVTSTVEETTDIKYYVCKEQTTGDFDSTKWTEVTPQASQDFSGWFVKSNDVDVTYTYVMRNDPDDVLFKNVILYKTSDGYLSEKIELDSSKYSKMETEMFGDAKSVGDVKAKLYQNYDKTGTSREITDGAKFSVIGTKQIEDKSYMVEVISESDESIRGYIEESHINVYIYQSFGIVAKSIVDIGSVYICYYVEDTVYLNTLSDTSYYEDRWILKEYSDKIDEFRTDIYAKCVLNGNTPLYNPITDFTYSTTQQFRTQYDNIQSMSTEVNMPCGVPWKIDGTRWEFKNSIRVSGSDYTDIALYQYPTKTGAERGSKLYCKPSTVKVVLYEDTKTDFTEWSATSSYAVGDKVKRTKTESGVTTVRYYVCIEVVSGDVKPEESPSKWKQDTSERYQINDMLYELDTDANISTVNRKLFSRFNVFEGYVQPDGLSIKVKYKDTSKTQQEIPIVYVYATTFLPMTSLPTNVSDYLQYQIKENENIMFTAPNTTLKQTFGSTVIFQTDLNSEVKESGEYCLSGQESVIFFWMENDGDSVYQYQKLVYGSIVKPSINLPKLDYTAAGIAYYGANLPAGKGTISDITMVENIRNLAKISTSKFQTVLGVSDTIKEYQISQVEITDKTRKCFWITKKDSQGKCVLFSENQTERILGDNEYLVYRVNGGQVTSILQSGTKIKRTYTGTSLYRRYPEWSISPIANIDIETITQGDEEDFYNDNWFSIPYDYTVNSIEMRQLLLGSGTTLYAAPNEILGTDPSYTKYENSIIFQTSISEPVAAQGANQLGISDSITFFYKEGESANYTYYKYEFPYYVSPSFGLSQINYSEKGFQYYGAELPSGKGIITDTTVNEKILQLSSESSSDFKTVIGENESISIIKTNVFPINAINIGKDGITYYESVGESGKTYADVEFSYYYQEDEGKLQQIPQLNLGKENKWLLLSKYSVNVSTDTQTHLYDNQKVILTGVTSNPNSEDGNYTVRGHDFEDYLVALNYNREIGMIQGTDASTTTVDEYGNILYLSVYQYKTLTGVKTSEDGECTIVLGDNETQISFLHTISTAGKLDASGNISTEGFSAGDECYLTNSNGTRSYYVLLNIEGTLQWQPLERVGMSTEFYPITYTLSAGNYILPVKISSTERENEVSEIILFTGDDVQEPVEIEKLSVAYPIGRTSYNLCESEKNYFDTTFEYKGESAEEINSKSMIFQAFVVPNVYYVIKIQNPVKYTKRIETGKNTFNITEKEFDRIFNRVIELDVDKEFDYLYQVDTDEQIDLPLKADSFLQSFHPYNRYTICQMDTYNSDIYVTNKVK